MKLKISISVSPDTQHFLKYAVVRPAGLAAKHFNAESQTIEAEMQMPTAFVLINTEIGSEADVLKDLKKVEGVEEANAVYGVYDIIARVKADTMDRLKEIVTWKVRRLDKVRSTLTMIVVEEGAK
ncbi:MAG: Lrp/AsnC ligand binding domain-containing protein [Candidatus Bathyarchaeia archaeon]